MRRPYSEGRIFGGKKYRYNGWWLTKAKAKSEAKLIRKRYNVKARVVPALHAGYEVWVQFN